MSEEVKSVKDLKEAAFALREKLCPGMKSVRVELSYREILFLVSLGLLRPEVVTNATAVGRAVGLFLHLTALGYLRLVRTPRRKQKIRAASN